jgi:hypothetical protein
MIQQLYITDYLSEAAAQPAVMIQSLVEQCPAFLKAEWHVQPLTPLAALWQRLGKNSDVTAAVLSARLAGSESSPVFCLLPVHLGLRRDTFSLQSVISLTPEVYAALTERLKKHFVEDFIVHEDPSQRYWWVTPLREINAQMRWPQDCLYQQALQWQPQGAEASVIRQWTNEIQMLLHDAAYSPAVAGWPESLNSLWFASVSALPAWQNGESVVSGQGEIFSGLQASQLRVKPALLKDLLADHSITDGVWVADRWQAVDWSAVSNGLQAGQISELRMVMPFAERSVEIQYKKQFRWQFWKKPYTLDSLLQQLEMILVTNR